MKQFGELGIELKTGIIFSVFAFVFSIIAGFSGKVPAGMILIRGVIIAPVFFVVGAGLMLVIKKFVPEVYEILSNIKASSERSAEKSEISIDTSDISETLENAVEESVTKSESGFSEFTEKDYERLQTVKDSERMQAVKDSERMQAATDTDRHQGPGDSGLDSLLNASGGKLGKHIIVENQLNSYEPKLMAQAIRTMMSKDKD